MSHTPRLMQATMEVRAEPMEHAPLRSGDVVVVRSAEEILATLDERGMIDGLPFMAEMLAFCGQRLRVGGRGDNVCDTIEQRGARRLPDAVYLEDLRCSGASHGGCEAECRIFWKEAWLRRADGEAPQATPAAPSAEAVG